MPKGVEHIGEKLTYEALPNVRPSLMPKGVEHTGLLTIPLTVGNVRPSLMPKGVEHETPKALYCRFKPCATLFDAERR